MGAPNTTPGPWTVETPMGDDAPWIVPAGLQAYEWEPIATLGSCAEDDLPPKSKAFKTITANAHQIAASGDGYSFADAFLEYVARSALDDLDFGRGLAASGLIEKAQTFTRKARGEAS